MERMMMKKNLKRIIALAFVFSLGFTSCENLTNLNENPNGVSPNSVNPNLVLISVLTETAKTYVAYGYSDFAAGVMQHTQKDAWFGTHNNYEWDAGTNSWTPLYEILTNNKLVYDRAVEMKLDALQAVALVMKSYLFGLITDLWGDVPYSQALQGSGNTKPGFDHQQDIYNGILADLETANTLLAKYNGTVNGPMKKSLSIDQNSDVYYGGDLIKWQKFANSLALRYYMRISAKLPSVAQAGIEKIVNNAAQYPVFTSEADDATMSFPGTNADTSWPTNTVYDLSGSNYRRVKMCAMLVKALQHRNDPRLAVWANQVQLPIRIDPNMPANFPLDTIYGGVRHISPIKANTLAVPIDTNQYYVGLPPAVSLDPSTYNLNPTPGQDSYNPHVSFLNEMYQQPSGSLLLARLLSKAEVEFILAEAALNGWNVGNAETHYNNGVQASLNVWGVGNSYSTYIAGDSVMFDNTLKKVIEQKWIASWTSATESWFDYRRTGLPNLHSGIASKRSVIPLRFYYNNDELLLNADNANAAMQQLQTTSYSQGDGANSAWSQPWIVQGTGKPW